MQAPLMEKISIRQLFILIVSFELGSAILIGLGAEAKQDAWIAVLLGGISGLALVWVYTSLFLAAPERNLYSMANLLLGRWLGKVVGVLYIHYFFYLAARVLRDLMDLLITAVYPSTPIEFLATTFMFAMAYVIYLGIEVFARTSELLIPYNMMLFATLLILLMVNGSILTENLFPMLAEGWQPVFKAAFPAVLTFPFGEMVVFLVLLAHVNKLQKVRRSTLLGVGASLLFLTFTTFLQITVLGPERVGRTAFPLLSVTRGISVGYIFERLDGLVVFLLLTGVFIKVGVFFFAGLKGIEETLGTPYRPYVLPMALLVAILSILIAGDYAEHLEEGIGWVPMYLHLPFQVGLPVLLWLLVFIRRRLHRRGSI